MGNPGHLRLRAEQQRQRRLARRKCGKCHRQATNMLDWAGRQIAICSVCLDLLNGEIPCWSHLETPQGLRCSIGKPRPCNNCNVDRAPVLVRRGIARRAVGVLFRRPH